MRFNIPTIGSRIALDNDLEIDLTVSNGEFAIFKSVKKQKKTAKYRDNTGNYEYFEIIPSKFVIPKGTILKLDAMIPGTARRPDRMRLKFSISESSLEKETGVVTTSGYLYSSLRKQRKLRKPTFYLKHQQFNAIDFEFAV